MIIPTVIESNGRIERAFDIYSRLLKERIVFIGSEINDAIANTIIAQIIFLEHEDPNKDITLYINSPGGSVASGLAIYDTMRYVKPEIQTICIGIAASMAAILLGGGNQGKRYILPHGKIMLHQPSGATTGQSSDIQIHAREIIKIKKDLNKIISDFSNKDETTIEKATDRDYYLNAKEAVEFGIVDHILEHR